MAMILRNGEYVSRKLQFALCDPRGIPRFVAQTVELLVISYAEHQECGSLILSNRDLNATYERLCKNGWTCNTATLRCKIGEEAEYTFKIEDELETRGRPRKKKKGVSRK